MLKTNIFRCCDDLSERFICARASLSNLAVCTIAISIIGATAGKQSAGLFSVPPFESPMAKQKALRLECFCFGDPSEWFCKERTSLSNLAVCVTAISIISATAGKQSTGLFSVPPFESPICKWSP